MATNRQRIAIIGAGAHAKDQHYPALQHIDEIDLCAACDLVPEKLAEVRERYEIPSGYADYREMIERESPDGVVVVMRPMEMVDVALGCLDLGVDLMIEKPPGCNLHDARQILERADAKGAAVMVSLNRRFMPLVRWLRDRTRERGLTYCSATYNKDGFFKDKWSWPSSLPVADSIHLIDLVRFVGGEVTEVFAASAQRDAQFTNSHSAAVVYESGGMATLNTHHCVGFRVHRFEVHAQGLSAYLDVGDTHCPSCELFIDGEAAEPPELAEELPSAVGVENYYETLHFARVLAGEAECEAGLADVVESVKLAESVATGYRGRLADFK